LEEGGEAVHPLWRKAEKPFIRSGGKRKSRSSALEESGKAVHPLWRKAEKPFIRFGGKHPSR
jgi:hypothetical protein